MCRFPVSPRQGWSRLSPHFDVSYSVGFRRRRIVNDFCSVDVIALCNLETLTYKVSGLGRVIVPVRSAELTAVEQLPGRSLARKGARDGIGADERDWEAASGRCREGKRMRFLGSASEC